MRIIYNCQEPVGFNNITNLGTSIALDVKALSNPLGYLSGELRRCRDFLVALKKLSIDIESPTTWDIHDLNMVAPIFRAVIEGYFKVAYVFSEKINEYEALNRDEFSERSLARFKEVQGGFFKDYKNYLKGVNLHIEGDGTIDLKTDIQGSTIKKMVNDPKGNSFVQKVAESFNRELQDCSQDRIYLAYRWCSIFIHGNANIGLLTKEILETLVPYSTCGIHNVSEIMDLIFRKYLLIIYHVAPDDSHGRIQIEDAFK